MLRAPLAARPAIRPEASSAGGLYSLCISESQLHPYWVQPTNYEISERIDYSWDGDEWEELKGSEHDSHSAALPELLDSSATNAEETAFPSFPRFDPELLLLLLLPITRPGGQ
jgi:hypothetical protein